MVEISALRLQDFVAFEPFAEIARLADAEIILHGGAAFRAALYAAYQDRLDFDLFDLVPFNSDIDLEHPGSQEKTAEIAGHIDRLVPFASWCRWSINDFERASLSRIQRAASTDIPLRRIRFSTAANADIPKAALSDLDTRRVSFARNPNFGQTDTKLRPDIEFFGLMMALNSWDEAREIGGDDIDFDEKAAQAWIIEGFDKQAFDLLDRPAIAARFWHLLSLRLARCGIDDVNSLLIKIGTPILGKFGVSLDLLSDSGRAFSVSKITSDARFRIPQLTPALVTGKDAADLFREIIRRAARRARFPEEELPIDPMQLIDPSLDLIGIVPNLTLLPFGSGKEDDDGDPFLSGAEQEFVQFAWDIKNTEGFAAHALTGQVLALGPNDFGSSTALPVVGGSFGRSRAWVRARLDDLIERGVNGFPVEAVLLILQARADETGDAEGMPRKRQNKMPDEAFGTTVGAPIRIADADKVSVSETVDA